MVSVALKREKNQNISTDKTYFDISHDIFDICFLCDSKLTFKIMSVYFT